MNVCSSRSPQTDDLEAKIIEGGAVFEVAAAIIQTGVPVAEGDCRRAQMRDCPASPPGIAQRLEPGEGAFARFDRLMQPTGEQVDLSETGPGKGVDLVQPGCGCDGRGLPAVFDHDLRSNPR